MEITTPKILVAVRMKTAITKATRVILEMETVEIKNEDDISGHEGEANDEIVKLISKVIDHNRYPHCSCIRRKA